MKIIFLIGARGSGKTTLGLELAQQLKYKFIDLDEELQKMTSSSINDIVLKEGWAGFRKREKLCLQAVMASLQKMDNYIIATGGGVVLDEGNRNLIHSTGQVFWLKAEPEYLYERLNANPRPEQRPKLSKLDPFLEIRQTIQDRNPLYQLCAHHIIDASWDIPQLCNIVKAYHKNVV